MIKEWYARWMYEWETRLTTRDENRVVRPLEWGFEWIAPFLESHGLESALPGPEVLRDEAAAEAAMVRINRLLIRHSDEFFGYRRPPTSASKNATPSCFPPMSARRLWPRKPRSVSKPRKESLRRPNSCASPRRNARPIRKTTW
jgi:hypothetical protein